MASGREGWGWKFWRGRERKEEGEMKRQRRNRKMEKKEVKGRWTEPYGMEELQVARDLIAGKESCSGKSAQSKHVAYKESN